jgi:hypothetical protein
VLHSLLLTRTLVTAAAWCAKAPSFRLAKVRIGYELAREAATVEVGKEILSAGKQTKSEKLIVIPDAWVEFERNDGKKYPILLEVDRGMEYSRKFKRHVRSRIEFIRSGAYKKMFQTDAVLIAYVTTVGQSIGRRGGLQCVPIPGRFCPICTWRIGRIFSASLL